jgi:heavy metal sensor kinase
MRFFKSIKLRFTAWYILVVILLLVIFGATAYVMLSSNLYENMNQALQIRASSLKDSLTLEEDDHLSFRQRTDEVVYFYDANGNRILKSGPATELTEINKVVQNALEGNSAFITTLTTDKQEMRVYAVPFNDAGVSAILIGRSTADTHQILGTFTRILVISGVVITLLAWVGGIFLARKALGPVDAITKTARAISERDLGQRIEVSSEDELGRLALTLNEMIERLESAFQRQRQFTADASHELRTPLAIIEAESTLAISKPRNESEYVKSLELISQESAFMSTMVDRLLYLARTDAGDEHLNLEDFNLDQVLSPLYSDVEVLAREKGVRFETSPIDGMIIRGDKTKIRQLFLNVLENAVKYTPTGGSISVFAIEKNGNAQVAIKDTGIGIPSEHLLHIFERFYRADKARSRAEGGAGLGLAIAEQIAISAGGKIEVESKVGKGATFYVTLPLVNLN